MRAFTHEEMMDMTEMFILVFEQNPHSTVKNLNKHLERSGFELVLKTVDVQGKYRHLYQFPPEIPPSNAP